MIGREHLRAAHRLARPARVATSGCSHCPSSGRRAEPSLPPTSNDGSDLEHHSPDTIVRTLVQLRWMLIPVFCELTGYSDKAVRRKIQDGKWIEGKEYRRAPDGHITMDIQAYYRWVAQ